MDFRSNGSCAKLKMSEKKKRKIDILNWALVKVITVVKLLQRESQALFLNLVYKCITIFSKQTFSNKNKKY